MTQLLAHFSAQWWTQHKTHFQFNSKSATISRKHHYRKTYILTAEVNFLISRQILGSEHETL